MAKAVEELHREIRSLNVEDRDALLRTLIADLDGEPDEDVERAWLDEAHRRREELQTGTVKPVQAEKVFSQARARLKE